MELRWNISKGQIWETKRLKESKGSRESSRLMWEATEEATRVKPWWCPSLTQCEEAWATAGLSMGVLLHACSCVEKLAGLSTHSHFPEVHSHSVFFRTFHLAMTERRVPHSKAVARLEGPHSLGWWFHHSDAVSTKGCGTFIICEGENNSNIRKQRWVAENRTAENYIKIHPFNGDVFKNGGCLSGKNTLF